MRMKVLFLLLLAGILYGLRGAWMATEIGISQSDIRKFARHDPDAVMSTDSSTGIRIEDIPHKKLRASEGSSSFANRSYQPDSWRQRMEGSVPNQNDRNTKHPKDIRLQESWRVDLPGTGHSVPLPIGEKLFVTYANEESLWIACLDLKDGNQVWNTKLHEGPLPRIHQKASHASSSPVTNGKQIFVLWSSNDEAHVTALNFSGDIGWSKKLGACRVTWGLNTSPLWYNGTVIVSVDNANRGFTLALNDSNGEILWCHHRPSGSIEGSYATPMVANLRGETPWIVLPGLGCIQALDAASGKLAWQLDGLSAVSGATPAVTSGRIIASSGYPQKKLWSVHWDEPIESLSTAEERQWERLPGGSIDSAEAVNLQGVDALQAWRELKESDIPYVPSPLIVNDRVFLVSDAGIASAWSFNGKLLWRKRVPGGAVTASPVPWSRLVVVACESGEIFLWDQETGRSVTSHQVGFEVFATPVIHRNRIVARGRESIAMLELGLNSN